MHMVSVQVFPFELNLTNFTELIRVSLRILGTGSPPIVFDFRHSLRGLPIITALLKPSR